MRKIVSLLLVALCFAPVACATWNGKPVPWKTIAKSVDSGQKVRIATHGLWDRTGSKCTTPGLPRLEAISPPLHGRLTSRQVQKKPSKCPDKIAQVSVYYTADLDYEGLDHFSYERVDSFTGERRLVEVEVTVAAGTP